MKNNCKVLLVDDDPVVIFLHRILLKRSGISDGLLSFNNGLQAIEYMDTCEPETTFYVLLDINMPVMNGWEYLGSILKRPYLDKTSVFMVSSTAEMELMEKASAFNRIKGYLPKPLTLASCNQLFALIYLT